MIAKTIAIKHTKDALRECVTRPISVPDFIYIAETNARCPKAEVTVKPGDHVCVGTVLGVRHGAFFDQPIHSSVSGTVIGLEKHFHRSGKQVNFIKIENDHKDEYEPSLKHRTEQEVASLTQDDLIQICKECSVVGLGGSSFPTYIKLSTKNKIDHILINAIECEPYITADHRIIMEHADRIVAAITLLQRIYKCEKATICIKHHHVGAIETLKYAISKVPGSTITVFPCKDYFPAGWEMNMIKDATGVKLRRGELPTAHGILNLNVATMEGLYLAVWHNMAVYQRFISVTGDGIVNPSNLIVRVGTPIKDLINACGGYAEPEKDKVLILGGPMMGANAVTDDCVATKTVTSVLVFNAKEEKEEPCIRCGSCVLSCPAGLQPVLIMEAVKSGDKDRMKTLKPLDCIECGLCSYSCTSSIRVTDFVRRAKIFAKL